MGAPVISADCPSGPSEIIEDGVNGRLVPVEDVTALAVAMKDCIADPVLRQRLGECAVKARDRFKQETIMKEWGACLLSKFEERSSGDIHGGIASER
jgi:glycosyltransferase involved in cell wall biosynthesis